MAASVIHTQLPISGMSCASCAARLERVLHKQPDVTAVTVNLTTENAYLDSIQPLSLPLLIDAVKKAGFDVPSQTIELAIGGMSCASCSARIERVLQKRPDVLEATVNLATERATITGIATQETLIKAITATGFTAHALRKATTSPEDRDAQQAQERRRLLRDVYSAALLWVAIVLLEMLPWARSTLGSFPDAMLQALLTTALLIGPGRRFFLHGLPALWRRAPEMNSLVAVGSGAAYLYSVCATFTPFLLPHGTAQLYYEAAAGIITLVLLGRFLEARAKGRTSAALRALTSLQPRTARVLREGTLHDAPIDRITLGDVIDIRPGERLPADGIITEGNSWIDEAMITGEPMAVAKKTGDVVIGGTVNQNGAFRFRTTATGGDTMLSHIITMVENAQGSKLPIQSRVNAITRWFVPAIMVLSALTFLSWLAFGPAPALSFALVNAVAVLIAACPCAMGLATPTAIMVGTGKGAELGILFRKGDALQRLRDSDVVAFDKTGTLTEGKPTLTDIHLAPGIDRSTVLRAVAAVESRSEHPLAKALTKAASPDDTHTLPDVTAFEAITGMGVHGICDGTRVQIGSAHFMDTLSVDIAPVHEAATTFAQQGKTPLYVALDGTFAALLAVSDPLKSTSKDTVAALQAHGLTVVMITGDQRTTAEAIGQQLGITDIVANVLPRGKVDAIKTFQQKGQSVTFAGDGINDAPALAQADVGVAVGHGTDIAMDAADVVLVNGQLTTIVQAIALSRATLRIITENLFWAFAYNIVLVPIAAGVLYPFWGLLLSPMFAAGAMALSSVCVLTNTLRLRRFTPPFAAGKKLK